MRAVVIEGGRPRLADLPEPEGDDVVRVRACGLCGSDVEKLPSTAAGTVLGHEVVGETGDGRRLALVHHAPCGECARCRAGHESTCDSFPAPTIEPGGFAERALARAGGVELPEEVDDVVGCFAEPLACVLRAAECLPGGEALVVGGGFVGQLFAQIVGRRGDDIRIHDVDPRRGDPSPPAEADTVVLCARAGAETAVAAARPGGTILVFADAGSLPLDGVYRKELTVVGSRSATPRHLEAAVALLPDLEAPPAVVLPLERFGEGLELYRSHRALKVVFTP